MVGKEKIATLKLNTGLCTSGLLEGPRKTSAFYIRLKEEVWKILNQ